MRFLFALIIFIMVLAIIVFAFNNVGITVPVTLIDTHADVPLIAVVIAAITFGVVFVGVVAITEGAKTRFENLRLRREMRKLETELNFLRTEPGRPSDRATDKPALPPPSAEPAETSRAIAPTAPVYGPAKKGEEADPEDDIYAGGGSG